jgi:hypothetical protein
MKFLQYSSVAVLLAAVMPVHATDINVTIKNAIVTGDIDVEPDTLKGGYDFRLTKKKQGDYADYSLSKFAPRPNDVADNLLEICTPFNLSDFLTKEITAEKMEQLLLAAETGSDVADDNEAGDSETRTEAAKTILETKVETQLKASKNEEDTPSEDQGTTKSAADILAQIRARANANKG